jgi:2-methylisocitrate lyase-like PEP mutase family enzyme
MKHDLLIRKAARLRELHRGPRILILLNVWDVASARLIESLGLPAIATSSAAVANSLGYADGECISRGEMLAVVNRVAAAVKVPVTADMEGGYSELPQDMPETAHELLESGAVGLNLEDSRKDNTLVDMSLQLEKLQALKEAGRAEGVDLVLNARTDPYLLKDADDRWRFQETVRRAKAYRDAGADCLFVPGLSDVATIRRLLQESPGPLNVLAGKGGLSVPKLERLGVARLSLGSGPARAALAAFRRIAREVLDHGTYDSMIDDTFSYDEMQQLFQGRSVDIDS